MKNQPKSYKDLIEQFPLRPIKNDQDLDGALKVSEEISSYKTRTIDQQDYYDVLNHLIDDYEQTHFSFPQLAPHQHLKALMQDHEMKQADLQKLLGIPQGRASELINGVRMLSQDQIMILAKRFNVGPQLFLPKPILEEIVPSKKHMKIDAFIQEAISKAKANDVTYWIDCNGLQLIVSKQSDPHQLIEQYNDYVDHQKIKDKLIKSATFQWYK